MLKEFKEFISKGSVLDMAIGVITGGALTALVGSLTKNILNPFISLFVGQMDLSAIKFTIGAATFTLGNFLNDLITFIIVSFVVFLIVKFANSMRPKEDEAPTGPTVTEATLAEIRDLLKQQENK